MPLNLPGCSKLKWGNGQGLWCLILLILFFLLLSLWSCKLAVYQNLSIHKTYLYWIISDRNSY